MRKFEVSGMSCAACQARVEKAVSEVPGVSSCSVSLITNSMGVEGEAAADDIIRAVERAGYGARLRDSSFVDDEGSDECGYLEEEKEALEDKETPVLLRRLISSVLFLIALMYISMGHSMLGLPLPGVLEKDPLAAGFVQMVLSLIILVINRKFFISGFRSLIHGSPNMDTLVALGSGVSFLWSVVTLFGMMRTRGDMDLLMHGLHSLYFESAAMIVTLITIGKVLEARSKGKTTDALKALMDLAPKKALLFDNGTEREIPVSELKPGDIVSVRPGGAIPCDGTIIEGSAAVDESALTGESIPVDKEKGDKVSAATINKSGYIKVSADRVGRDTTLAQIIKTVSDAQATKAPIAKIADRVSGVFVPLVILAAVITAAVWLILGKGTDVALTHGIAVLVVSCPCALGLATPVAIMVGSGVGARNGILFKTSESLEMTGKIGSLALDKTGTITKGEPVVTDVIADPSYGKDTGVLTDKEREQKLVGIAYSIERLSEHPIAQAIVRKAEEDGCAPLEISSFEALTGSGLKGKLDSGEEMIAGRMELVGKRCAISEAMLEKHKALSGEGKTSTLFALDGELLGIIAVSDEIKEDSREAVEKMRGLGIRTVMMTGDTEEAASRVAAASGVDSFIASVLPDGKADAVRSITGLKGMVGDGINDAPALKIADVGIAIGAGTDIAIDAADVVLVNSSLMDAYKAIKLSRATVKNIHENLFWAFFYNVLLIPLAAGVYTPLFGWSMDPMWGAAAMSLSSFCVCMNALRLNLVKLDEGHESSEKEIKDKDGDIMEKVKDTDGGKEMAEKTLIIEGMMCAHCEMNVKNALLELDGVESAEASHEEGKAVVELSGEVPDEALVQAVTDKGYEVKSVE